MPREFINNHYYIVSIVILCLSIGGFCFQLKNRKPEAKEIITIMVMSGIAVAFRASFIMFPFFKPMSAIVMIAGMALGPYAGALVGTLSSFASNFIFGQGAWTPWQMIAYGVAGLLAGVLCKQGWMTEKKRFQTGVVGFFVVVIMVGPILDTFSIFTMANAFSIKAAISIYLSGLPVNVVHGVATFVTILVLCKPMMEKLNRIKIKYGMLDGGQDEI